MKLLNEILSSGALNSVNKVLDKLLTPRFSYVYDYHIDDDVIDIVIDFDTDEQYIRSSDLKNIGKPEVKSVRVTKSRDYRTAAHYQIILGSALTEKDEDKLEARLKKSRDKAA